MDLLKGLDNITPEKNINIMTGPKLGDSHINNTISQNNTLFFDYNFDKSDSIEIFLKRQEDFFYDLNVNSFENIEDFESFMDRISEMFGYIDCYKDDLLSLPPGKLGDLKQNFRGIQRFFESLFDDELFITRMVKGNAIFTNNSFKQSLYWLHSNFEDVYYKIIPSFGATLPRILTMDKVIESLDSDDFLKEESFFHSVGEIDNMCDYVLSNNLSDLNLDQVNKLKSDVEIIFDKLENIIENNQMSSVKECSLQKFINSENGLRMSIESRIEELVWREKKVDMITSLPSCSAQEMVDDEKVFKVFLHEFRNLSKDFMDDNSLRFAKKEDLLRIRKKLIEVYAILKETGSLAISTKPNITFNTDREFKRPLALAFGIDQVEFTAMN